MSLSKALTAAAGNAGGGGPLYVEDVFSTYLYDGSGAARTIANGIPLSDEGGLVWLKNRALDSHVLFDTVNGPQKSLASNNTAAGANYSSYLSFPSAGTAGWDLAGAVLNGTGTSWASWTFRKAEKFFDVQTYTGNGVGGRTVSHNLGSTPGMIIVKNTSTGASWSVFHTSRGPSKQLYLNLDEPEFDDTPYSYFWDNTAPTSTEFTVGTNDQVNGNNFNYVAYLFASDAGGFGEDETENIIKCGSYTGNGNTDGPEIDCGFEPQWILLKNTTSSSDWILHDSMRGLTSGGSSKYLEPNTSNAEAGKVAFQDSFATGFKLRSNSIDWNQNGATYIYIAIRRPMKIPESGTEVFAIDVGGQSDPAFVSGFPVDMGYALQTTGGTTYMTDRIRGTKLLPSDLIYTAETNNNSYTWDYMDGMYSYTSATASVAHMFKRAPGFFDVVAYNGTGSSHTEAHNLGVAPELILVRIRENFGSWYVYAASQGATKEAQLNDTIAFGNTSSWSNTAPTASVFTVNGSANTASGYSYIAYLFATLDGVSKVGSYTGTGSNLNVDCGFSAGARFILIKRANSTGDWYIWDSVRGIVAGNDPYMLFNSTAAQVTNTDYVDPLASGFTVTSNASGTVNVSGGTYIFLAIA